MLIGSIHLLGHDSASGLSATLCFTLMFICSPCNLSWILMQEIKRDAFREAYVQCSNAIQKMESELRKACHTPDAKVENVLKVRITDHSSCSVLSSLLVKKNAILVC